jgi:hypothetical protein
MPICGTATGTHKATGDASAPPVFFARISAESRGYFSVIKIDSMPESLET